MSMQPTAITRKIKTITQALTPHPSEPLEQKYGSWQRVRHSDSPAVTEVPPDGSQRNSEEIVKLGTRVSVLEEELRKTPSMTESVADNIEHQKNEGHSLKKIVERNEQLWERVSEHDTRIREDTARIDTRVVELHGKMEEMEKFIQTNQRMNSTLEQTHNKRMAEVEERLDEMNRRMATLEVLKKKEPDFDAKVSAKVNALHEQYEDAMGKYGEMAAAIAELKGSFDTATDMSKRMQSLEDIYESHKKHMQTLVKPIKLQLGSLESLEAEMQSAEAEMQSTEAPISEYYQDIVNSITSIHDQLNELKEHGALDRELAQQVAQNDKLIGVVLELQDEMDKVQQRLETFPLTIEQGFKAVSDTYASQDYVNAIWNHITNIDSTITADVTANVTKNMSGLISGLETTQEDLEKAHNELQASFETIDTTKDEALGELSGIFRDKLNELTKGIVNEYQQRIGELDGNIARAEGKSEELQQSLGEAVEHLREEKLERETTMEEARNIVDEYKRIAESVKKQLSSNGKDNLDIADVFEKYEIALQEAVGTISVLEKENAEALASAVSTIRNTAAEYYENVTALKDKVHNEYDTLSRNVEALAAKVTDGRQIQQKYLKDVQETETRVKAKCEDVIAKVQAIVAEGNVQRGDADKHLHEVEKSMANVLQEFNKVSEEVRSESSELRNIQASVRKEFDSVSKSVTQLAGMVVEHGATQAKQQDDAQKSIAKIKVPSIKVPSLDLTSVSPVWERVGDNLPEQSGANVERSDVEYADSMKELRNLINGLNGPFEKAVGTFKAQTQVLERFKSTGSSPLNSTEAINEIREKTNDTMYNLNEIYTSVTDLHNAAKKIFDDGMHYFSENNKISSGDDTFREMEILDEKTSQIELVMTEVDSIVGNLESNFKEAQALSEQIDEMAYP